MGRIIPTLLKAGRNIFAEAAKRHGVSKAMIYIWCKKSGSMEAGGVKHLKMVETENARIRMPSADRELKIDVIKETNVKSGKHTGSA